MQLLFRYPYQSLALVLVIPALIINLGLISFIDDEAIRALVAFEMKHSGNYINPTLHATYYYSKPPLFNWILLVFFNLFNRWDEFVARLPTVVSTLGFAATIYYFVRLHLGRKTAFVSAFAFITCGRVLFWDSFLALIDITYSWVTFTSFMVIYHYWKKRNWNALFLLSYFLTAVGFLLKGFPSLLFQFSTLGAWFLYQKEWKKLFSIAHIKGVLLLALLIGSYYYTSSLFNHDTLITKGLLEQAASRTVLERGVKETLIHLFSFPLEMSYHFLPWSLLFIYFFKKSNFTALKDDSFLLFLFVTFVVNIPVYWTSPRVYPRYVLMLFPLLFILGVHFYKLDQRGKLRKVIDAFWGALIILFAIGSFLPLLLERNYELSYLGLKVGFLATMMMGLSFLYYSSKSHRMLILICSLLVTRIGFDWFVLPDRYANDDGTKVKNTSIAVGNQFQSEPLFVYKKTLMQPANSYYLSIAKGAIIPRKSKNFRATENYIVEPSKYPQILDKYRDSIYMRHDADRYFYIGNLNITPRLQN